jgi:hypothetical protein
LLPSSHPPHPSKDVFVPADSGLALWSCPLLSRLCQGSTQPRKCKSAPLSPWVTYSFVLLLSHTPSLWKAAAASFWLSASCFTHHSIKPQAAKRKESNFHNPFLPTSHIY